MRKLFRAFSLLVLATSAATFQSFLLSYARGAELSSKQQSNTNIVPPTTSDKFKEIKAGKI